MSKAKTKKAARKKSEAQDPESYAKGTRETIESIVVAIILAFLFRAFIAEAFVIPTGSMAPALQGQHKDVVCYRCGYQYRTGASLENLEGQGFVAAGTCPICRYTMSFAPSKNYNQASFTGDRILVSKFAYDLYDPQRWDVIVFKYPGNAKQNYIKRLIGLPNEIIRIYHGDIYAQKSSDSPFQIARKPAYKQKAMMQVVDDTKYIAPELVAAGWPLRWQSTGSGWQAENDGASFTSDGTAAEPAWIRYQHFVPSHDDWKTILAGREFRQPRPQLIADFYAYNAYTRFTSPENNPDNAILGDPPENHYQGIHWVGDLAVQADVRVDGNQGALLLDLIEGGVAYRCRIDVATGQATLQIGDGTQAFSQPQGANGTPAPPQAATAVRGPGNYSLRFANVDDQLRLWVNGRLVDFGVPTTYDPGPNVKPQWTAADPGDLAPVRVGSEALALHVKRLKVLRDVYYIAVEDSPIYIDAPTSDYEGYESTHRLSEVQQMLSEPNEWSTTPIFDSRREVVFVMGEDDFFPLGDNSPHSKDARLWEGEGVVERRLLTGKALMIYWPHSWNAPVVFTPNFSRMGFIR